MFKKILYPTDFSENAEKAMAYVKQLKDVGTQEVVVLNVIHQRTLDTLDTLNSAVFFQDGRYHQDREEAVELLEEVRRKKLEPIAADLKACGFAVSTLVRKGHPRKEILKVEQEEDVSAIVIGSKGKSGASGLFLGSVSEKVVRRSKTSVVVVK